jgi:dihydrodipicolinate synthase/N-acetylneuraminate lyase
LAEGALWRPEFLIWNDAERLMFTGNITPERLRKSVLSVPSLARNADLTLNNAANGALIRHMQAGGISTFLYGGNANFYNVGVGEFPAILDMMEALAGPDDWMIPSVGADFGKAMDQLGILKTRAFPTAMVLPLRFPATKVGAAKGLARLAEHYGRKIIAYIKDESFIAPEDAAALLKDGHVVAIKYAIVREDPRQDAFLSKLIKLVDPALIVSGIGERPIIDHARHFGLRAFTSGSVCVAPRLSTMIRQAIQAERFDEAAKLREHFLALEDLRDGHSPLRVLHEAIRLAGIADTGPILPFLSNIDEPATLKAIADAANALRALNDQPASVAAE